MAPHENGDAVRAVLLGADAASVALGEVDEPELAEPGDALVAVRRAAICGSDLHILDGRAPGVLPGSSLGHEFTGRVTAVGEDVTAVAPGDRVVGAFLIPCGRCPACERRAYEVCTAQRTPGAGMFLGDLGGAQAERLRVPNADLALMRIPDRLSDEQALFCGDILSTAYYVNRLGGVAPGVRVAVQGCGPVGLLAVQVARALGAERVIAVDLAPGRLEAAARFGAEPVDVSVSNAGVAVERLLGAGADVVLDTLGGRPPNLLQALDIVRAGGTVAVVGLYTDLEATLPLAELFMNAISLRFGGFCPVPALWRDALALVEHGDVDPLAIVSHRLPLEDAPRGYELFRRREALKVVLEVADA